MEHIFSLLVIMVAVAILSLMLAVGYVALTLIEKICPNFVEKVIEFICR